MKSLYEHSINRYRRMTQDIVDFYGSCGNDKEGLFDIPMLSHPSGCIKVIASSGDGWDHVSASFPDRCPTWDEMCALKDIFFHPEEMALQFHPPKSEYVNFHPYTLHLWRPHGVKIELPTSILVGPRQRRGT